MPKDSSLVQSWIKKFPELFLNNKEIFCKACSKVIASDKKFQVIQHTKTALHQTNCKRTKLQLPLRESFATSSKQNLQEEFNLELCDALISANIPLTKLSNPSFKLFLEKYTNKHVLDQSTLRKKYVDRIYIKTITSIRDIIGTNYIYFSVDETTDSCGRYIANLIIGVLNCEKPCKPYLINSKELEKTDNVTIARFVSESLSNFFLPEAVPTQKIILMLSDAAPYMLKAGQNLKIFYPNLIHTTCLAHGINRVAEKIRDEFPLVNSLINNVKKIFVKAPLRVQLFKEKLPDIALPPKPVITRWGTWLDAALYYANNFNNIKELIFNFDDSSSAIKESKFLLKNKELPHQLAFIRANYVFVSTTLTQLQAAEIPLIESIEKIQKFQHLIQEVKGDIGTKVSQKLHEVLHKNEGFNTLTQVSEILKGKFGNDSIFLDSEIIGNLKNAPITSVDVERSFSRYKNILTDKRQSFLLENLEKHLIINCYSSLNNKE